MQQSDHEWIGDNRDFVRAKLDEFAQSQQEQNGQESTGEGDKSWQQGGSQEERVGSEQSSSQDGSTQVQPGELSDRDVAAIQEYIQKLESQQDQLQPYLNRFGTNPDSDPLDSLEEYLFGDSSDQKKDW